VATIARFRQWSQSCFEMLGASNPCSVPLQVLHVPSRRRGFYFGSAFLLLLIFWLKTHWDLLSKLAVLVRASSNKDDSDSIIITVDIISIGSRHRQDLLQVQRETFGSHKLVRNFFAITEEDDDDPYCAQHLNSDPKATIAIREMCGSATFHHDRPMMQHRVRHYIFRSEYLDQKPQDHIAGWMCAQKRPVMGLLKAMEQYHRTRTKLSLQLQNDNRPTTTAKRVMMEEAIFPDFLIIMDDDTYYNMDMFANHFSHNNNKNNNNMDSRKTAMMAGCIYTSPIRYPQGGIGSIWTRGLLQAISKPIHCHDDGGEKKSKMRKSLQSICSYIQENNFGERRLFRDGMSLLDIIGAYTKNQKLTEYQQWTPETGGYCLHSDLLWGWLMLMIQKKMHPRIKISPWNMTTTTTTTILQATTQNSISTTKVVEGTVNSTDMCGNEKRNCQASFPICHYQSTESMIGYHKENRIRFGSNYVMSKYKY
jgi:hypothetical protein